MVERGRLFSLLPRRRRWHRSARRRCRRSRRPRRPRRCRSRRPRHDDRHGRRQHPKVLDRLLDRREPRELAAAVVVVPSFSSVISGSSGSCPSSSAEKGPGRQRPRRGRERLSGLRGEVELGLHWRPPRGEDDGRCVLFGVDERCVAGLKGESGKSEKRLGICHQEKAKQKSRNDAPCRVFSVLAL